MFKFQGVIVGSREHERLFGHLTDLAGAGKEVVYEEYVVEKGNKKVIDKYVETWGIPPGSVIVHEHREVWCRGHAIP